ncbi:MAG: Competence protein-like protein [Anaerocolumna sp.]|nr:Competence protein-like protein [Anaerocolumna sp.]
MENCIYHGDELCSYNLKDKNNYYNSDLVEQWKLAAAKGELICSDCGQRVYLAAGPIMEPYFAHYDKKSCDYSNVQESEELRIGKRLLYTLLKKSFPSDVIRARHKMKNGMYSTLYLLRQDGREVAIDYRLQRNGIDKFNERSTFYKDENIVPIYVLGIGQNTDNKQISWYEKLIQKEMGYCIFINSWKESILLKKIFDYTVGGVRKLYFCQKEYYLADISLQEDYTFSCDFYEECTIFEEKIKKEKNKYIISYPVTNEDHSVTMIEYEIRKDILKNALDKMSRGEEGLVSRPYVEFINKYKLLD